MPTSCRFVFTRNSPVYYSGEAISGSVHFRTTKKLRLEAITLALMGHCRVEWRERSRALQIEHNDCTKAENPLERYRGVQECHSESVQLRGSTTLEPGTYSNDFSFTLPEQCPATVSVNHGEVEYEVNLTFCPVSTHNKVYKHRILIRNRRDLMEEADHKEIYTAVPATLRSHSDKSKLQMSLTKVGFVPGQVLRYSVDLFGGIDVLGSKVLVELCQRIVYTALVPVECSKDVVTTIVTIITPDICGGTFDGALVIPLNIPISSTNNECLIQISYYLSALRIVGKIIASEPIVLPIIIGTIPSKPLKYLNEAVDIFCYDNLATTEGGRHFRDEHGGTIYSTFLQSDIELSSKVTYSDRTGLIKKLDKRHFAETPF